MATKTLARSSKSIKKRPIELGARKLRKLIDKQQALSKELLDLMEELDDAEDIRRIKAAMKRNKNEPLIPWGEAKKRLGLKFD